ncbi:MAG: PAS domain S-box protein [Spirochaetales bacterium]|nr:PAS domain S-box protein [Spirochaetales bacterium]
MRRFIERALAKLNKLDSDQIHALMYDLAYEHERLNGVLDSLSDGIMVADVENNLIMFNKAAERLVPFAGSDGYDHPIWESITDDEISGFVEQTLETQESVRDREFAMDRSGMTQLLAFSITPLVRDGQIHGTIIHVEDVSERRGREARLRRAESLASLTTLAAGVAHEIKNPLGSIGIHVQLIQKALSRIEAEEVEQIEGYVDVVNEEVERLNRTVVDFLFAVRPMDTTLEDRDLNAIVHDLLEFVRFELNEANIEIQENFAQDLPNLEIDEKYLKQALLNIVKNAISAMPDGGVFTVSSRHQGDVVILKIKDTGLGMSEEVLNKIFEPYFTTKDFGSGIGLTMVYKVVKEHMGDISVVSQEGKGSSFSISFPVPQREQHLLNYEGGSDEV